MLRRIKLFLILCLLPSSPYLMASDMYLLQPGDQLSVTVWREEELSREFVVLPDGRISYPLVGHVMAAGISPSDLESILTEQLEAYITEPQVNVSVVSVSGNVAYVFGEVNNPGPILMNNRLTVIQALSLSGGFTKFAETDEIKVIRGRGQDKTVLLVDYPRIESGANLSSNVTLRAGDVILVP